MKKLFFIGTWLCVNISAWAQGSISGTVINTDGQALAGANVFIENTYRGTTTDTEGNFDLNNLRNGYYKLHFTYVGYNPEIREVKIENGSTRIEVVLSESTTLSEEIVVVSTRANGKTPVAFSTINKETLNEMNTSQDIPYLLSLSPSVICSSDAGTGIGYTNLRVRGTDMNRINVCINGIPLNDAESHGVWWVDLPDIASSTDNIQLQRGVGTSTNGAGAFGASVNLQTSTLNQEPYATINSSMGSFGTQKNTISMGTGLIGPQLAFDGRVSRITSDGYIDHSGTTLESFFVSGGYYGHKTVVKANVFAGREKTQLAWDGVPDSLLTKNRTYNGMGVYTDTIGNLKYYDNETDNYTQSHYQLIFSHEVYAGLNLNAALHYTHGEGYYEEFKEDRDFSKYGLEAIDTISSADFIQQKWLDNDFYGVTFAINYNEGIFDASMGGGWNQYKGNHFGKVKTFWAADSIILNKKEYEWYRGTGNKTDWNVYGKTLIKITGSVSAFVDLQYRHIDYTITGIDDNLRDIGQKHNYNFFNPKAGLFVQVNEKLNTYLSFAIGHREPNRSNFTDAPADQAPTYETLQDLELGLTYNGVYFSYGANIYYMDYKDQLVLTGAINDVGDAIMVNVPKSYRTGIELTAGFRLNKKFNIEANTTISQNKIKNFTQYIDNWDTWGQDESYIGTTNIAFSPNITAAGRLTYSPIDGLNMSWVSRYVGKQYIDNTSSANSQLNDYLLNDFRLAYKSSFSLLKNMEIFGMINNIFNKKYCSSAWVYHYVYESTRTKDESFYPQAGRNFSAGVTLNF